MTTYYPIQTTVGLSAIGSTALESITAGEIIRPETPVKQPDLCDVIGVGHSWRPYENRPTIEQDPARAILGEKTDLGRMSVGALVYQIEQRERIKEENLARILYQEVEIGSQLLRLSAMHPEYLNGGVENLQSKLSTELPRLEQQKRAEEIECWRDLTRLKEKLVEALAMYRDVARRYEMVHEGLTVHNGTQP
jgi:hypothetical protein